MNKTDFSRARRLLAVLAIVLSPTAAISADARAKGEETERKIAGKVTDYLDGTGIPAVRVVFLDNNNGVVGERTTDADGYFDFSESVPGKAVVASFRKGGYLRNPENRELVGEVEELGLEVSLLRQKILAEENRDALEDSLEALAAARGTSVLQELRALADFEVQEAELDRIAASLGTDRGAGREVIRQRFDPSLPVLAGGVGKPGKPRIAVLEFANKADSGWYWWSDRGAAAMQDVFITELVKSGKFQVIDRERLDALMEEKNLALSGDVTPATAVQAGQLLGVEYFLVGSVTEYGATDEEGSGAGRFGLPGVSASKRTFVAAANARIINAQTGEIVWADEARGEERNARLRVGGIGGGVDNDERMFDKVMKPVVEELAASIQIGNQ